MTFRADPVEWFSHFFATEGLNIFVHFLHEVKNLSLLGRTVMPQATFEYLSVWFF